MIFLLILLFFSLTYSGTITVANQTDFNLGTYTNTFYNTSESAVHLTTGQTTGSYESQIFDAGSVVNWNSIDWLTCATFGKQLPDNGAVEGEFCGVDMSSNVLLLHFNESSGATTFADSSGIGNVATCASCPDLVPAIFGNGAQFDETSFEFLSCPAIGFSHDAPVTIESWVFFPNNQAPGNYDYIMHSTSWTGTGDLFTLSRAAAGATADRAYYVEAGTVRLGPVIPTGSWTHLAMVFESPTTVRFYMDGEEYPITQPAVNVDPSIVACQIGRWGDFNAHYLTATLDDLAVYNKALNATEIKDRYVRGVARYNISVRSCDDPACAGEPWIQLNTSYPQSLTSISPNQYFQFRIDFERDKTNTVQPAIYNVTIYFSPPTVDEDKPRKKLKSFDFSSSKTCNSLLLNLSNKGESVDSANILILDPLTNYPYATSKTNSSGLASFDLSCGRDLWIKISKPGFYSESFLYSFECDSYCNCDCGYIEEGQCITYECCSDSDCPSGYACNNNQCEPQGCLTDNDCAGNEYCNIPNGELVGSCEPVTGECGYAENHQWINYECCSDSDCPTGACITNQCVEVTIECPQKVSVGEEIVCFVKKNGAPCVNCEVEALLETNERKSLVSDEEGKIYFPATYIGSYVFIIKSAYDFSSVEDSGDVRTIFEEVEVIREVLPEWILYIMLLLVVFIVFEEYLRRKNKRP